MSDQSKFTSTTQTTSTWPPFTTSEYNACPHRLPCGICRITNDQCPKFGWGHGPITYTGTSYINKTDITCNTTEGKANE